jgi:hypothetical protein
MGAGVDSPALIGAPTERRPAGHGDRVRPTSSRWPGLLALLLACGPSPGEPIEGEDGADAPATLAEACTDLFARLVAHDERCIGVAPAPADAGAYVDSCVAIVESPGSTLTIADVSACAGRLADEACDAYQIHPDCLGEGGDLLYPNHDRPGTRAPGAACMAQVQCASGHCSATGGECGQCQRARARGESCSEPFDLCVVGECIAGLCDLGGTKPGEGCIDYGDECQSDLYCRRTDPDEIAGICTARGAAGESCDAMRPCAAGLYCGADGCSEQVADGGACPAEPDGCASGFCVDAVCGRPAAGLAEGADCTSGYCRPALACADNVCTVPDGAPLGDACLDGECAAGLHCEKTCTFGDCGGPGVCAVIPGPGEPCTIFAMCAPGAACVGFGSDDDPRGTCVRLGSAGDVCPCGPQLACVAGTCGPFDPAVCG